MIPATQETMTMPVDPLLRRRIRVLMAEQEISQKELAARTGLRALTISHFLRGHTSDVRLSTLESIARALNCRLEVLLTNIESE